MSSPELEVNADSPVEGTPAAPEDIVAPDAAAADAVETVADAAKELEQQAEEMQSSIDDFLNDVAAA